MHILCVCVCVCVCVSERSVEEEEGEDKKEKKECIQKLSGSCSYVASTSPSLLSQMDAMNKMRSITELVQSKAYKDKVKSLLWL